MREQSGERKSAGSRSAAKSCIAVISAPQGRNADGDALVDERRFGSGKPLALTRGWWKRSWRSAVAQRLRWVRDARGFVRSWRGAVKRCSTWGRIAERWSDAALRMASGLTLRHIAEAVSAAKLRAQESSDFRVLVSLSRLQMSVRSILPSLIEASREACQETR